MVTGGRACYTVQEWIKFRAIIREEMYDKGQGESFCFWPRNGRI